MTAAASAEPACAARATPACLVRAPRENAPLRLLCFHHAGGGASFFAPWPGRVVPSVDVLPVQLPGREARYREPRFDDVGRLAEALVRELEPWLREPYAFYGHSMGALVAFAVAAARERAGGRAPSALFVGAYAAPHRTPPLPPADRYGDAELARFLVDVGGLSPEFLGRDEWLSALLPVVRDDLRICASHRKAGLVVPARPSLDVHAFAGADDTLVDPEAVRAWERYARTFRLTRVPGGHFFPREAPAPFFRELNAALVRLMPGRAGRSARPG
ncbi:thioesterase II family protein [Streptomyces sp. MUM 178J]|uniref:thioesterase II family protein n=1 Tax=Streptomyces sp. MUM 178J TaxID=2791991 RepID=UPI001F040A38|nr:thioesterase domain-containing protein [Streptomyces sp. MUM 178J]WRQ79977.1 thioesterase domain-containing protein [Streptomyces sp. MUM 178J]